MQKINRRQFFILSAAGAVAASIANWASREAFLKGIAQSNKTSPTSSKLYKSANGLLELNLSASDPRSASAGNRPVTLAGKQAYLGNELYLQRANV
jgi:hypothetical protein